MRRHWLLIALFLSTKLFAAPMFQADLLGGEKISLKKELEKGKHVLVSFWATWCTPCIQELTEVQKLLKANKVDLNVIAVNTDDKSSSAQVRPLVRQLKLEMPIALDPSHDVMKLYHGSDDSLPFSVLLNPKGEVVETFSGYKADMEEKLVKHTKKSK